MRERFSDWLARATELFWQRYPARRQRLMSFLLPSCSNVLCDPISGTAIITSLIVSAAATAAQVGLQALMASRQKKPNPIDRGKLDDARVSTAGFNEAIVWGRGKWRSAPVWIWHTPIVHSTVETGGSGGSGKGFLTPKVPTPTNVEHIYTLNVAGVFLDGVAYNGVSRIWFNAELVFDGNLFQNVALYREAEFGILAGGASVVTQASCSNGRKVTGLGSGGKCTIAINVASAGSYEIAVGYLSTTDLNFEVKVNGGTALVVACPSSGGSSVVAMITFTRTLTAGANSIEFGNASAAAPDLDRIQIVPLVVFDDEGHDSRPFTGLIDENKIYPPNPDHSWAFQNELPVPINGGGGGGGGGLGSGTGGGSATLAKFGNPRIRVHTGTPDQAIDTAILAAKGVGNASAYRNYGIIVIEGIQVPNATLPNTTIETDQGTRDVETIVADIYELCGVPRSKLNLAQLAGLTLGDSTGFNPGTYSAVTWASLVNASASAGGEWHKSSGAANTWNASGDSGNSLAAGVDNALRFTAGAGALMIGFATTATPALANIILSVLLNVTSFPDLTTKNAIQIFDGGTQSRDVGTWTAGDKFQLEVRDGQLAMYQNGLLVTGYVIPVPAYPMRFVVMGYSSNSSISAASFATGANIGTRPIIVDAGALVSTSRKSGADLMQDLMIRFQFDMVNLDGKETAVLRNATSDVTIPYTDMRAHGGGEPMPEFDAEIIDLDAMQLPREVIVNYSDPQLDYHTGTQSDMVLSGPQQDVQNVPLSIVDHQDNMKRLAVLLLNKAYMESRSFRFSTGPKWGHVHPGTIATLQMRNATHIARCVSARLQLPAGKVEFEFVRHAQSLYVPTATGSGNGSPPIVTIVANTHGVILDCALLRPEDAGDGTEPVYYWAMCGRGSGAWNGSYGCEEYPIGSGLYQLITIADRASMIGQTTSALGVPLDASGWDRDPTHAVTINFYTLTELTSATEDDLLNNPLLNCLALANPTTGDVEFVQFKTATPGTAAPPFLTQYTVSTFLRGRFNTDARVSGHSAADDVVVIDNTIRPRRLSVAVLGRDTKFKFVSSGQAVVDAAVQTRTLRGNSLRPLAPCNLRGSRNAALDLLIQWTRRDRWQASLRDGVGVPLQEQRKVYVVQVFSGATLKRTIRDPRVQTVEPVAWKVLTDAGNNVGISSAGVEFLNDGVNNAYIHTPDQTFAGDFIVEFVAPPAFGPPTFGVMPARDGFYTGGGGPSSGEVQTRFPGRPYFSSVGGTSAVRPMGNAAYQVDWFVGDVISIHRTGDVVKFYKNFHLTANPIPIFQMTYSGEEELKLYAEFSPLNDTGLGPASIQYGRLDACPYPVNLQIEDFGSAQNPIKVRVMQESAIVGLGDYVEGNL